MKIDKSNNYSVHFEEFWKAYPRKNTKGSGKTMLACCIVNEVLKEFDIPVNFISMPEYIELVYQFL